MTNPNQQPNFQNPQSNGSTGSSEHGQPVNQLYGQQPQNVQDQPPKEDQSWRMRIRGLMGTIQLVAGAVLLAVFINTFVFQSYQVVGDSMNPTLLEGDRLIINKMGKSWNNIFGGDHTPKRGDIIVFDNPNGDDKQLVKRVIGIPGDRVEIVDGILTVFNDEFPQGFDPDAAYGDSLAIDTQYNVSKDVTPGNIFVAGDNRIGGASLDSRNELGLVPLDNVIGKLVMRLLPLAESRLF